MVDQIAINVKVIDSEVGPKLRHVRSEIQSTIAAANRTGGATNINKGALDALKDSLLGTVGGGRALRGEFEAERLATERFRESIHFLHPVLESAGLGFANMRAYSVLAGAGMKVLGAAIVGSVILGLAKLSDQSTQAKKKLEDVYRSPTTGGQVFDVFKKSAAAVGTDAETLAAGMEQIQKTLASGGIERQLSQGAASPAIEARVKRNAEAVTKLYQAIRAGSSDEAEATKQFLGFTKAFGDQAEAVATGKLTTALVTPQMIAALPPGAGNAIAGLFGRKSQADLENYFAHAQVSLEAFVARVASSQLKLPAPDTSTFSGALDELLRTFKTGVQSIGGEDLSHLIGAGLNDLSAIIKTDIADINALVAAYRAARDFVKNAVKGVTDEAKPEETTAIEAAGGAEPLAAAGTAGEVSEDLKKKLRAPTAHEAAQFGLTPPPPEEEAAPEFQKLLDEANRSGPNIAAPGPSARSLLPPSPAVAPLSAIGAPAEPPFEGYTYAGGERLQPLPPAQPAPPLPAAPEGQLPPGGYSYTGGERLQPVAAATEKKLDTSTLQKGTNDAASALETLASRTRNIQIQAPAPQTGSGAAAVPGQAHGGLIAFARGGVLRSGLLRGKAEGGVIRGPGTGTSDSILARLDSGGLIRVSNGEGIVTADGMGRIGVSGLDRINKGFADGGVPLPAAASAAVSSDTASGSSSSSGRTVELNINVGGKSYPAQMHESVADRLATESAMYLLASGGGRSAAQS